MGRWILLFLVGLTCLLRQQAWGATSVHLQCIRVESQEELQEVLAALDSGQGFDELAERFAPEGLRSQKGYLGEVTMDRLASDVRRSLGGVGPGGVSPPVPVEGGWFLFRVLDAAGVSGYRVGEESPWFYLERGILLGELGDLEGEMEAYRKSISLDPRLAPARANLGEALRRRAMGLLGEGRGSPSPDVSRKATELMDEAIDELKAAIAFDGELWEAHFNLGLAYAAQGLVDLTILEFREAVRIKPDSGELRRSLALALLTQGRLQEAKEEARKAEELGVQVGDVMARIQDRFRKGGPQRHGGQ